MSVIKLAAPAVADSVASAALFAGLASIVEELTFNALDAGATEVRVRTCWSGWAVTVEDNGHGVAAADVPLLGVRHATSKTRGGATYGSMGRGLASIAVLGRLEVASRAALGGPPVWKGLEGTTALPPSACTLGAPVGRGTSVRASHIFASQPVRRKALDAAGLRREMDRIVEDLTAIGLVHPSVLLRVYDEDAGAEVLLLPRAPSTLARLSAAYGPARVARLRMVHVALNSPCATFHVSGYVGRGHGSKELQVVYLQGRFARKVPAIAAIIEAAAGAMEERGDRKKDARPSYLAYLLDVQGGAIDAVREPERTVLTAGPHWPALEGVLTAAVRTALAEHAREADLRAIGPGGGRGSKGGTAAASAARSCPPPLPRSMPPLPCPPALHVNSLHGGACGPADEGAGGPPSRTSRTGHAQHEGAPCPAQREAAVVGAAAVASLDPDGLDDLLFLPSPAKRPAGLPWSAAGPEPTSLQASLDAHANATLVRSPYFTSAHQERNEVQAAGWSGRPPLPAAPAFTDAFLPRAGGASSALPPLQARRQYGSGTGGAEAVLRAQASRAMQAVVHAGGAALPSHLLADGGAQVSRAQIERAACRPSTAYIGQLDDKFLLLALPLRLPGVCTLSFQLVCVDQHAADERARLEALESYLFGDGTVPVKVEGVTVARHVRVSPDGLLVTLEEAVPGFERGSAWHACTLSQPLVVDMSPVERHVVAACASLLQAWGFNVHVQGVPLRAGLQTLALQPSGHRAGSMSLPPPRPDPDASSVGRVALTSLPRLWDVDLSVEDFRDFIARLRTLGLHGDVSAGGQGSNEERRRVLYRVSTSCRPPAVTRILNSKACRGAIMFGDTLRRPQAAELLQSLAGSDLLFQCAHGRPSLIPLVTFVPAAG